MKKLLVVLLALAIAAFAAPVFAGEVSMEGEYTFGGEAYDGDDSGDFGTFYDELDLDIEVEMGDVLFHWDVEVVDDGDFDREDGRDSEAEDSWANMVDTMWVKWQATDALAVKIGDYGIAWANDLVIDDGIGGTGTIGLMYAIEDVADLAFYLSRDDEAGEDDITTMGVTVEGEMGPVEAGLMYLQTTDDITDDSNYGLIDVYGNFGVGPVAIALEYGQQSADWDDEDGGSILLAEFGLEDLVGFGLNIGMVQTNEEWAGAFYSDDFDRAKIYDAEETDQMMVFLGAEYGVNDRWSVGLDAIVMNDVGDADGPTEIDVWTSYAFADNVSAEAGYAMLTANDAEGADPELYDFYEDATLMWYEFVFAF